MKDKKRKSNKPKSVMGRPFLPQGKAKTITLSLKVSQEEIDFWTKQAEAKGMKLRQYILHKHRLAFHKWKENEK